MTELSHWLLRLPVVALMLFCMSASALAGNIFFNLTRSENRLIVTNIGDSTAYYPEVFRLLDDGRWEPLSPPAGQPKPVELLANGKLELSWAVQSGQGPMQTTLPVMVRFFDQAGSGIGQISFFNQPLATADPLVAGYQEGWMVISPPSGVDDNKHVIRATWLLWPQEDGIAPLAGNLRFEHQHPSAHRIEWRPGLKPFRLQLGNGLPSAMLLHETARGYELQVISGGALRGREQHAFWLGKGQTFFRMGLALVIAAVCVALLGMAARWRRKQA